MVFNRHYGVHEELPFDLRHKGGSMTFDLPPKADKALIAQERKRLKDQFVSKLRPLLQRAPNAPDQNSELRSRGFM
jgi:hypothetical protein